MTLKTNQIIELWVQAGLSLDFINNASDWDMIKNGIISSQCPDGFITDLKVGDFVEWKNDYNITFKSRVIGFGINELCEYLSDKFVYLDSDCFWFPVSLSVIKKLSDVNVSACVDMLIKNIEIIWSESNNFTDGEILTLEEYDSRSMNTALEIGRGEGYAKTKINIHLANGKIIYHHHNISTKYPTLTIDLATYGRTVIQALADLK